MEPAPSTVQLSAPPLSSVSVTVSSSDTGAVRLQQTLLTFTSSNWDTAQTVTVAGVDDDDDDNEPVTVTLAATGGEYQGATATVAVTVTDDDTPALTVDPTSVPVAEGGDATFTVRLATRPTAAVVIGVVSGDPGAVSVQNAVGDFHERRTGRRRRR